jgi:hypothetical protein
MVNPRADDAVREVVFLYRYHRTSILFHSSDTRRQAGVRSGRVWPWAVLRPTGRGARRGRATGSRRQRPHDTSRTHRYHNQHRDPRDVV